MLIQLVYILFTKGAVGPQGEQGDFGRPGYVVKDMIQVLIPEKYILNWHMKKENL